MLSFLGRGTVSMHFHLPKPLHGWREFVGEVGIIVIGVLLALGAESLIEQWHWKEKGEISTEAFKAELENAGKFWDERVRIQPCQKQRIRELSEQLISSKGRGAPLP